MIVIIISSKYTDETRNAKRSNLMRFFRLCCENILRTPNDLLCFLSLYRMRALEVAASSVGAGIGEFSAFVARLSFYPGQVNREEFRRKEKKLGHIKGGSCRQTM